MTLNLATLREGWDFEAKLAAGRDGRGSVPASLFETYSAMANTDGGVIVLGVAERGDGGFDVAGLTDAARVEQELWDLLDNRQKVSVNVLMRRDVTVERLDERDVLVIRVPRAHRTARPVYLRGNPMNAFRRSGQGDRRCTEPEVRRMIADASDVPADSAIVEGCGRDALDDETIEVWSRLFRGREPNHPFLAGDTLAMLRSVGAWRSDATQRLDGPTVAGLLMFGRERAILDRFPWYQLDYREIDERTPEVRWVDRVTLDGKWPGNVFSFYRRVEPRLVADLKVPFQTDAHRMRIDSTPAHDALREALVNALIHADYTGTRGIRVFKRRGSYELVNPGLLRVPWDLAVLGNASDPRNPGLQKMFQLVGFGDRAGSGVPRIALAWRAAGWPEPEVSEDFDAQETRLVLDVSPPSSEQSGSRSEQSSEQSGSNSEQSSEQSASERETIRRVRDSRRAGRSQVEAAILAVCRQDFVELPALAAALNRAPSTLRTHYVNPMLVDGRMVARHPDQPTHPRQAYQAARPEGTSP